MEGVLMENEKILVPDEGAENTEQTVEKTEKTYTEAEFNAKLDEVLGKKIARNEAKIRKEYDRKYGELETVLRAGMGKEDVGEITEDLRKFYGSKGVKIEKKPQYSAKDIEALAKADADEIIGYGDDEVAEEVDRLAALGADKMSARDKAVFKRLAEHRQKADMSRELSSLGVTEDVYNSEEFKEFQSKFNPNTPIKDIYDIYNKTLPKKEFKNPGSMKSATSEDNGVKDYYSYEESLKFTRKDFDKNPALYKAVCNSMTKW
jgi:hypothetical protein